MGVLSVIARGLKLIVVGIAIGLLVTFAGLQLIAHLLTDVNPFDWTVYAVVATLLGLVGIVASA